ncbi:MAG TPA: hypothetical protein VNG53_05115 [Bacteroidia bacterium]|nr:hypothetical protein [Bacteroidia bacterium]
METTETIPQAIEKEKISELKFNQREVLPSADSVKHRWHELQRAAKLGNMEHGKIKIIFEDVSGLKEVETTIWAVTDNRIVLKKGVIIPIHCIHEVKI